MRRILKSKKEATDKFDKWTFQPKRIRIPSTNWCLRNDSSNISAILHPDVYLSKENKEKHAKVERKCCLSTNTCYCNEKRKIKPSIFSKPNSCITLKEIESKIPEDDLKRVSLQCLCKEDEFIDCHSTEDSLKLLKKLEKVQSRKSSCLEYTGQRNDYETFRNAQEEEEKKFLNESRDRECEKVSTILGTKHGDTNTISSNSSCECLESLNDVENFRKNHYFETHSVKELQNLSKSSQSHTCVHQFTLDNRFLPLPINKDVFGRSTCAICEKPMEGSNIQLSKGYFSDKPTLTTLKNYARSQDYGLAPRTINIGGKRSKIEVKLGTEDLEQFGRFLGKMKKPQYCNSLALRQQKMRGY